MTLDQDTKLIHKNRRSDQVAAAMFKRNSTQRSPKSKTDRAQSEFDFDEATRRKSYSLTSQQRPHSVVTEKGEDLELLDEATEDAHSSSKLHVEDFNPINHS